MAPAYLPGVRSRDQSNRFRRPLDASIPRALRLVTTLENGIFLANICRRALASGSVTVGEPVSRSIEKDIFGLVLHLDAQRIEFDIRPFAGGPFHRDADPVAMTRELLRLAEHARPDGVAEDKDRAASFLLACTQGSHAWRGEPDPIPQSSISHRAWDDGLPNFSVWDRTQVEGRDKGAVPDHRLPDDAAIVACAGEFPAALDIKWEWGCWYIHLDDPASLRNVRPMDPVEVLRILDRWSLRNTA